MAEIVAEMVEDAVGRTTTNPLAEDTDAAVLPDFFKLVRPVLTRNVPAALPAQGIPQQTGARHRSLPSPETVEGGGKRGTRSPHLAAFPPEGCSALLRSTTGPLDPNDPGP
jgi:hypothetical protein